MFSDAKDLGKTPMASPLTGATNIGGVDFRQISCSETMQDRDTVTMKRY